MKHYEQPEILLYAISRQDVLGVSNPDWQDDPFSSTAGGVQ